MAAINVTAAEARRLQQQLAGSGPTPRQARAARGPRPCSYCTLVHLGTSSGECAFINMWAEKAPATAPTYVREVQFVIDRGWRFDFAWPDLRIAVEIDGGTRMAGGGRHNRAAGFAEDCVKLNAAVAAGWRVLRYTTEQLANDPGAVIDQVCSLLGEIQKGQTT